MLNQNLSLTQIYFFILITFISSITSAKVLSLSFDDGLNPDLNHQAKLMNDKILEHLDQNNVQAIVYPSLTKIGDVKGKALIEKWSQQGHEVANHSASHQNLNRDDVSVQTYIQSIAQAEAVFENLDTWTKRYRFPFLKEGNTLEKRDAVRYWLKQNNYQSGAVSIDASDWFYNQKFIQYQKNNQQDKFPRLKAAYLQHLLDRAKYYDELALKSLGYSPKHVLLLHVNAINAEFLDDVIVEFRKKGWTIISSKEAYDDPLYKIETNILPAGESIIWSIAKQQGLQNLRYPAEDAPYEQDLLKEYLLD
jgi:peptidoglycan-N-acetylglucosamine deacetylase